MTWVTLSFLHTLKTRWHPSLLTPTKIALIFFPQMFDGKFPYFNNNKAFSFILNRCRRLYSKKKKKKNETRFPYWNQDQVIRECNQYYIQLLSAAPSEYKFEHCEAPNENDIGLWQFFHALLYGYKFRIKLNSYLTYKWIFFLQYSKAWGSHRQSRLAYFYPIISFLKQSDVIKHSYMIIVCAAKW